MTALVTGATGTVGSAIVSELLAQHRPVRALVRSIPRARAVLPPEVELVDGDITDAAAVGRAMAVVQSVFHSAGLPEQWQRDTKIFDRVNAEGTRNAVEAALAAGVDSFVHTSTIDVFEWPDHGTFDESRIDATPKSTYYERSKQAADRLAVQALDRGLPVRFVHPAGVYGPAPVITPGLNRLLVDLARNKIPMLLPGGLPVVHAVDCARLHLAAESAGVGSRYIASERYLSLADLARSVHQAWPAAKVPRVMPYWFARVVSEAGEAVSKATGRPPLLARGELSFLSHRVQPDSSHARRELGWNPRPFVTGVAETLRAMEEAGQLRP
ncbi:NAD-dependent epimerase/dehydratase family protein [Kitasatospora sp. NPDC094015]|uniref:NAD-dependent epimerase/dehydratase family protein n=1 Tax=Kitasatospora sp. NPDC094015 TaxID=3155205 RepID=UPI00332088EB